MLNCVLFWIYHFLCRCLTFRNSVPMNIELIYLYEYVFISFLSFLQDKLLSFNMFIRGNLKKIEIVLFLNLDSFIWGWAGFLWLIDVPFKSFKSLEHCWMKQYDYNTHVQYHLHFLILFTISLRSFLCIPNLVSFWS